MNRQSEKITALYCRVDGGGHPENSLFAIQCQQEILAQYARVNDLNYIRIFSDCGYSGITLDRPAFQSMLLEIEAGNMAHLVVKDMSRLVRDYLNCAQFMEETLARYGVTLHTICDGLYLLNDSALLSQGLKGGGN